MASIKDNPNINLDGTPPPESKQMKIKIQPPSTLLMGGTGSGKTHSISTLAEAGLDVFVITTEPVGLDTLIDVFAAKNLLHKLHWCQINPNRQGGFSDLIRSAEVVSMSTYEGLAKMAPSGNRKQSQFIKLLKQLEDFHDERTQTNFGPVENFNDQCALVIDSLSGLNIMAMDMVIGDKSSAHQGEWGVAMGQLERLINNLTSQLKCHFVLTTHLEKETNELTGATQIMSAALGRKLAPKLPRFFSEVVMAYRQGETFFWSTATNNVDLKKRSLPLSEKITPSFVPIVEAYRARLKAAEASVAR